MPQPLIVVLLLWWWCVYTNNNNTRGLHGVTLDYFIVKHFRGFTNVKNLNPPRSGGMVFFFNDNNTILGLHWVTSITVVNNSNPPRCGVVFFLTILIPP